MHTPTDTCSYIQHCQLTSYIVNTHKKQVKNFIHESSLQGKLTVDLKNSNLAINMMLKKAILEQKKNATLSDFRILVAATREVAHAAIATLTLTC